VKAGRRGSARNAWRRSRPTESTNPATLMTTPAERFIEIASKCNKRASDLQDRNSLIGVDMTDPT
jgi:hypothetical protein